MLPFIIFHESSRPTHCLEKRTKQTSQLFLGGQQEIGCSHHQGAAVRPTVDKAVISYQTANVIKPSAMAYIRTSSRATMMGEWYEVKTAGLIYLRCKNNPRIGRFQLASNVAAAGALDDLVLRYQTLDDNSWNTIFTQLKHKGKGVLHESSLTGPRGDFSLRKYLRSFIKIKETMKTCGMNNNLFSGSFDKCQFVLYTNCRVSRELAERERGSTTGVLMDIMKSQLGNEVILKLNKQSDQDIYSDLKADEEMGSEATEFLEKLTVLSGQPTEAELDDIIKKELLTICGGAVTDDGPIYRIFEGLFKQWWRDCDHILDENSDILRRTLYQLYSETELPKQMELLLLSDINFNGELWNTFNTSFSEGVSILHVVTTGRSIRLSVTKVRRLLQKENRASIFLRLDYLVSKQEVLMSGWMVGKEECLVIASEASGKHGLNTIERLCLDIKDVLNIKPSKKIVVVSMRDDCFAGQLKDTIDEEHKTVHDVFDLRQLDQKSQEQLWGKEVSLQDHKITVKALFQKEVPLLTDVLPDTLVEALLTNKLRSIAASLSDVIPYYIARRLKRSSCLKEEIFTRDHDNVFALTGVTHNELKNLALTKSRVRNADDSTAGMSGCLILDPSNAVEEFNKLCKTHSNVHWLHVEAGKLEWRRSSSNIAIIKRYTDERLVLSYETADIVRHMESRIALIIAEPGMGKSTLIPSLAQDYKEANAGDWIIQVNLLKHYRLLDKNFASACDFLMSATKIQSPLEKELFRICLERTGNVVVLLDGFDEIAPNYTKQGCALLTNLLETRVKKVVITSRQTTRDILESHLATLAFEFTEFTEQDQRDFFYKFWMQSSPPRTDDNLKQFITNLVYSASSLIDRGNQLLGIPLQAMMLAEVYKDVVMQPTNHKLPAQLDVNNLIEQFIDMKFDIYFDKCYRHSSKEDLKERFLDNHMHVALTLLFTKEDISTLHSKCDIIRKTENFVNKITKGVDNSGIVHSVINGKPNFIHRAFAEFLAALWFSKNYTCNKDFLKERLFTPSLEVVRGMFHHLISNNLKLHRAVLNIDTKSIEAILSASKMDVNLTDRGERTALHLAAALGFKEAGYRYIGPRPRHTVELLLEHRADVDVIDAVMGWTPIEYALRTRSWDVMDYLIAGNANTKHLILEGAFMGDNNVLIPIIRCGFVNVLRLFLDCGLSVNHKTGYGYTLLHEACWYNNAQIASLLISKGADIVAGDWNGRTCLHWTCFAGKFLEAKALVDSLKGTESSVLEYVNMVDKYGYSAVQDASREGHPDCVGLLISHGADVRGFSEGGRNCLHEASESGHLAVVEALIDSFEGDEISITKYVNTLGKDGNSALQLASKGGHLESVRVLISHGADVTTSNQMGRNALHDVSEFGHLPVAQALVSSFGDNKAAIVEYINTRDSCGLTAKELATKPYSVDSYEDSEPIRDKAWRDKVNKHPVTLKLWLDELNERRDNVAAWLDQTLRENS